MGPQRIYSPFSNEMGWGAEDEVQAESDRADAEAEREW